jgi:hypothetical protein
MNLRTEMGLMNLPYKYLTPSLLLVLLGLSVPCHADPVDIGIGGHLYGEYSLGANQSVSESFTLGDATQVTSLSFGISPVAGGMMTDGSFQVIVSGAGGVYYSLLEQTLNGSPTYQVTTPLPDFLPAGDYNILFEGGPCGNPCYGFVAGIDYFSPAIYQEIGGTAQGPFGFQLVGEGAPEPGTWILAGTALALIPLWRYRQRKT